MSDQQKVAVVLLNWNGVQLLKEYLPSVLKHSDEADIYVIDNGSTDESLKFIKSHSEKINLIPLKKNYGFCGGYNKGLNHVENEIFILLNTDVRVSEGWLSPIIEAFKEKTIAVVQPKILSDRHPEYFEYAGAAGGFLDKYGFAYCRGRLFDSLEKDNGQYNEDIDLHWGSGACFGIRRKLFFDLGGFDETFFAHMEEIDLCWRLRNRGFKIKTAVQSKVFHLGGGTLNSLSSRKLYLNYRNNILLLYKNLKTPASLIIPLRLILDGISGIRELFSGKPINTLMIIKAHFSSYGLILSKKVKKDEKASKTNDHEGFLIWNYFIKGKREWSQLKIPDRR